MKKVVLLSPAHPLRGGIASSSERLAQEMMQQGYEVEIISFYLQYPKILFPGKTQYTSDPAPEGVRILSLMSSINPLSWWRVGKKLQRERPDWIVVRFWLPFMGPCFGTVLRLAKRNKHTRIFCIPDNIVPHESRPGDRMFTRYFINPIEGFIVMSKAVGQQLRQFSLTKPFRFVPHPIYDNYGEQASREESLNALKLDPAFQYLLFFGFIRDYKGLDLLLKAFADQRLASLPLKLIVAGEYYGNEAYYQQIIEERGLADRLEMHTQYIPKESVRHYFGAADLVVQPYKSATQSGISQLAFHFEKPMVVTEVGGLPEIVKHGTSGYVVPISEQAIADAILDFFEAQKGATMTAGVRQEKGRFAWGNLINALLELEEGQVTTSSSS